MNKGLTLKMGQTNVPRYHHLLLEKIEPAKWTRPLSLRIAFSLKMLQAYGTFRNKKDGCIKVVLTP